jgi:DNA-dependent metalloprotease WSS1
MIVANSGLGLNINRGQRICVRVRFTQDPSLFLHLEQICDTVLHELSHIVWGPHDDKFHRLWDELRDEHETLLMKGFTGENFLSKGNRLGGGSNGSRDEAQRRARLAAQKRAEQNKRAAGSGQRLGGSPAVRIPGSGIRQTIADAVTRRNTITQGCASGRQDAEKMAEEARQNGFRTTAELDEANEVAIANALIELMEENEAQRKRGSSSTAVAPISNVRSIPGTWDEGDNEGLRWNPATGLELAPERSQATSSAPPQLGFPKPPEPSNPSGTLQLSSTAGPEIIDLTASPPRQPVRPASTRPDKPLSRLVREDQVRRAVQPPAAAVQPPSRPQHEEVWSCPSCTLDNHRMNTVCEMCETPRPDLGHFWWACMQCGFSANEKRMWSCGRCGHIKPTS